MYFNYAVDYEFDHDSAYYRSNYVNYNKIVKSLKYDIDKKNSLINAVFNPSDSEDYTSRYDENTLNELKEYVEVTPNNEKPKQLFSAWLKITEIMSLMKTNPRYLIRYPQLQTERFVNTNGMVILNQAIIIAEKKIFLKLSKAIHQINTILHDKNDTRPVFLVSLEVFNRTKQYVKDMKHVEEMDDTIQDSPTDDLIKEQKNFLKNAKLADVYFNLAGGNNSQVNAVYNFVKNDETLIKPVSTSNDPVEYFSTLDVQSKKNNDGYTHHQSHYKKHKYYASSHHNDDEPVVPKTTTYKDIVLNGSPVNTSSKATKAVSSASLDSTIISNEKNSFKVNNSRNKASKSRASSLKDDKKKVVVEQVVQDKLKVDTVPSKTEAFTAKRDAITSPTRSIIDWTDDNSSDDEPDEVSSPVPKTSVLKVSNLKNDDVKLANKFKSVTGEDADGFILAINGKTKSVVAK